jgi:hypothetical protein
LIGSRAASRREGRSVQRGRYHRGVTRFLTSTLVVALLAVPSLVQAQNSEDLTCNRAVQDFRETCQKRIGPLVRPADPSNPTAQEQKAMDKHAKAWQSCKEKSDRRAVNCRR